jgi:pimeloyl-ACP methyl ester carboxylesterase
MEPEIRYCKTRDGVSIAYYALGEGAVGILMGPIPIRNIRFQWEVEGSLDRQTAAILRQAGKTFVQFDARGLGSSSRTDDFSLEAFVSDLEAVANELGDQPFDLVAVTFSCPIAIAYAALHRASRTPRAYPTIRERRRSSGHHNRAGGSGSSRSTLGRVPRYSYARDLPR